MVLREGTVTKLDVLAEQILIQVGQDILKNGAGIIDPLNSTHRKSMPTHGSPCPSSELEADVAYAQTMCGLDCLFGRHAD